MLFPVKKLTSITSTEQYFVSASQTTEDPVKSKCPLLLKYHSIEDTNSYLLDQCTSGRLTKDPLRSSRFHFSIPETSRSSSFPDLKVLRNAQEMPKVNDLSHRGLIGLYNLENTCFLNSIIQCLRFTEPLYFYIANDDYLDELNGSHLELVEEFAQLVKELWSCSLAPGSSISPRPFSKAMHRFAVEFDGHTQQDAHEFLLCLLTALHENLNNASSLKQPASVRSIDGRPGRTMWQSYLSNNDSCIIKFFVGQLRSTLICTACHKMSPTYDPFWDLSLPIPSDVDGEISIEQCLSECLNDELIDGTNMPFCSKCKRHKPSQKRLAICRLPKILILHLKRFTEDQEKLNNFVNFPIKNLDLGPYCSESTRIGAAKYNLYAVVNHTGSMSYGHYTAFCHHQLLNEWFEFNDNRITLLDSPDSAVTDKAYILFYKLWAKSSKL